MHLNHYENPYSRLAQYDELRMRQHGSLPRLYADDMTSDNTHLSTVIEWGWTHSAMPTFTLSPITGIMII